MRKIIVEVPSKCTCKDGSEWCRFYVTSAFYSVIPDYCIALKNKPILNTKYPPCKSREVPNAK